MIPSVNPQFHYIQGWRLLRWHSLLLRFMYLIHNLIFFIHLNQRASLWTARHLSVMCTMTTTVGPLKMFSSKNMLTTLANTNLAGLALLNRSRSKGNLVMTMQVFSPGNLSSFCFQTSTTTVSKACKSYQENSAMLRQVQRHLGPCLLSTNQPCSGFQASRNTPLYCLCNFG